MTPGLPAFAWAAWSWIRRLDWRALTDTDALSRCDTLLQEDRARAFDLTAAPLLRLTTIRGMACRYAILEAPWILGLKPTGTQDPTVTIVLKHPDSRRGSRQHLWHSRRSRGGAGPGHTSRRLRPRRSRDVTGGC